MSRNLNPSSSRKKTRRPTRAVLNPLSRYRWIVFAGNFVPFPSCNWKKRITFSGFIRNGPVKALGTKTKVEEYLAKQKRK